MSQSHLCAFLISTNYFQITIVSIHKAQELVKSSSSPNSSQYDFCTDCIKAVISWHSYVYGYITIYDYNHGYNIWLYDHIWLYGYGYGHGHGYITLKTLTLLVTGYTISIEFARPLD